MEQELEEKFMSEGQMQKGKTGMIIRGETLFLLLFLFT
jgi:hypothetical protein